MRENKPHSGESASPQSSLLRSLNSFQDDPDILSCARKKTQRDNVQEDDFKCIRIDWISVAWEERITKLFMSAEVSCGWQGGQGQCNTLIQAHKAGYSRTVPHCCLGVASLSWAFGSSTWSHQLKTSQKDVGITSHIPSSTQNTSYISTRPMKRTSHSVIGRLLELERLLKFFFFPIGPLLATHPLNAPLLKALDVWRHTA